MDAPEPETPFAAVSAQTTKFQRVSRFCEDDGGGVVVLEERRDSQRSIGANGSEQQMYQNYLDKSTPYTTYRWIATATVFIAFGLRIVFAQGWYIGTSRRADKTHGEQSSKPTTTTTTTKTTQTNTHPRSRLLPRHLPPQPLPSLHLAQIRPQPRVRHRHGRRHALRPVLPAHQKRRGVQAFRAPPS
jgi:hypothetical protein